MSIRVTFLGGLGEVGRNSAILEVGGRLALIDCGLMFPEDDMLGVDLVLPDFSSVLERAADLTCVVLTHGHEDHIGALSYLLRDVAVPVYGSPLTLELARSRLEEMAIEADLRPVGYGPWVDEEPFRFQLLQVSHSVPHGAAVAFDTPQGIVLHSGDFKLDPTPVDGHPTDLPAFAELGRRGVRLLLADSTNAERSGFVPSETSLAQPLYELIIESQRRVVVACFASHLHRVQQVVNAAVDAGRYVGFLGRSMVRNVDIGERLGVLEVPDDRLLPLEELLALDAKDTCIISTGSQGEPFAALSLMASGQHHWVTLEEGDTVVISATPIPGNEIKVSRVINGLIRKGVTVHHGRNARVHVSGHGAQEELKTFLNIVRPQAFVPVHGEYRHLAAHAALASRMGVPNVVVCEDGDAVVCDGESTRRERNAVPAGYVYLDGDAVGDVARGVLRDRRHLADDGVVAVTVGVDGRSGEIVFGPDLDSHGLSDQPGDVLASAGDAIVSRLGRMAVKGVDMAGFRNAVREETVRVIRARTSRRPVVFPIVVEL